MSKSGFIALIAICAFTSFVSAQDNLHRQSSTYQWPDDPLVKQKLEKWRDQKFGMLIHWGLYSVPGILESWSICSETWVNRDSTISHDDYKKWYWGLNSKFNPVKFDPDQWARAAKDAGMRYVVFTTKHHDGFAMFDTKQSEFKITGGPFATHPKANVTKHVFDAFRKQGFMIGAYFSKPDWHSEYYWWPRYATPDRNANYDVRKHSWRWNKFKEFTYNQLSELMHGYGSIDVLWLDGGWVRPLDTVTDEVKAWGMTIPEWSQDIDIPRIATMARKAQPGLLVVDRTVHGPYENYQTPEQVIPKGKLDHPWESCITLGEAWGYVPNDRFKSSAEVIHTLVEIVAKGGNLVLGVSPNGEGVLLDIQIQRMKEIGEWMTRNGDAIYNTRPLNQYQHDHVYFTKGNASTYAIALLDENAPVPQTVEWEGNLPKKGSTVKLLATRTTVKWKAAGDKVQIMLPASFLKSNSYYPALVFEYSSF